MQKALKSILLCLLLLTFSTYVYVHGRPASTRRNNRIKTRALDERGGSVGLVSEAATIGPIKAFYSVTHNARRHLVAAGVARSVSIFGMYPVDTVKVRKKAQRQSRKGQNIRGNRNSLILKCILFRFVCYSNFFLDSYSNGTIISISFVRDV